jgi:hypothetical protein
MPVHYNLQLTSVARDHTFMPSSQVPVRSLAPLAHYAESAQLRTDVNVYQVGIWAGGTFSGFMTQVRPCEALRAGQGVWGEEVGAVGTQVGREEGRLVGEQLGVAA